MRRTVCRIFTALCAVAPLILSPAVFASSPGEASPQKADEALKLIMEGNRRYIENCPTCTTRTTPTLRETLAKGQRPHTIVLTCSDSRVAPELLFDQTLGEIFVVRVAGNVIDPTVLGSIEYAAEHLGSSLLVVLGHERCGAVAATVDAKGKPEGNIGEIVKTILPAVQQARKEAKGKDKAALLESAIDRNIRLTAAGAVKRSPVLAHLVKAGKLRIVAAKYDLDDGKVTVFPDPLAGVKTASH